MLSREIRGAHFEVRFSSTGAPDDVAVVFVDFVDCVSMPSREEVVPVCEFVQSIGMAVGMLGNTIAYMHASTYM